MSAAERARSAALTAPIKRGRLLHVWCGLGLTRRAALLSRSVKTEATGGQGEVERKGKIND